MSSASFWGKIITPSTTVADSPNKIKTQIATFLTTPLAPVHLECTDAEQKHRETNQPRPQPLQRHAQAERPYRTSDSQWQTARQRCQSTHGGSPPDARYRPQRRAASVRQGRLLYISVGDGGDQRLDRPRTSLSSTARSCVSTRTGRPRAPTRSRPSNPYASSGSARHEIWASGFRNPWRFSFDARDRRPDRRRRRRGHLGGGRPGAGARDRARRQLRLAGLRGLRRELSRRRPPRSSPTHTPTPAATSPTAARSSAATSTAAPRSLSSPAAISTRTSAPASSARSSSAFRSPAATEPRARPAP